MEELEIGIRKYVEFEKVRYWLAIKAKPSESEASNYQTIQPKTNKLFNISVQIIHNPYWKIFILFTILINIIFNINYYFVEYLHANSEKRYLLIDFIIIVHLTCFFFWIDFLAAVLEKITERRKKLGVKTRRTVFLVIEAVSLVPLSTIYLIVVREPNISVFLWLRTVTLLRFYRIPDYISSLATADRNDWKVLVAAYTFYLIICFDIFTNIYLSGSANLTRHEITDWNKTIENQFIVSLYFSSVTLLNVGYGDIYPKTNIERIVTAFGMTLGCVIMNGVLTGALATELANMEKRREIYRHEFEAVVNILKGRKIEKKILERISENLQTFWKYKKGYTGAPPVHILPRSLQKEIFFDINFGFLSRSLIFSKQPRSFLRSVSLLMKNMSFLPGDIIMEPVGISDAMLCVASGVIEILSEENDETPLFSLTTGTILGEAALFAFIPIRCVIRASTYVELQVLMKLQFCRSLSKYPEIFRSMRTEVLRRFTFHKDLKPLDFMITLDSEFHDFSRRKAVKRFLQDLRKHKMEDTEEGNVDKTSILRLYVLTENIPRVKTMPINLIKLKPWILRPDTTLTELWNIFIVITVSTVVFVYPYLVGFVRKIDNQTYAYLFITEIIYIIDLYIQCTTAIERKDHFTYITSVKEIIGHKLTTVGFYIDILATLDLSVYAEMVWPKHPDYAHLVLSLNRMLKFWHIPRYFLKVESRINSNLLFVRAIKFLYYLCTGVVWCGVIMYLEACPGEICIEERWFNKVAQYEVKNSDPTPCTEWPAIISLYWACLTLSLVGYGDIAATAIPDCLVAIFTTILGAIIMTLCVAQASATLKHLARERTQYQEEIFAVGRFMSEHEISKDLQSKVKNYFQLQWTYDEGFSLKNTKKTEGLAMRQRQIIITEVMKTFLSVPLFRETDTHFLRNLAKFSKIRVLPPNEVIVDAGSFGRELYILENGYCEVSLDEESPWNEDKKIIGPVNSFGFLEMLLGTPQNIRVQTLTHARIISLDYSSYLRTATKYPNVKARIDAIIENKYSNNERNNFDTLGFKPLEDLKTNDFIQKIQKKLFSKAIINVYKYQISLQKNYWEPFQAWGKFRFLKFLLLPFVIVPHSSFIKYWMTLRVISVVILGLIAPIHFSLPGHTEELFIVVVLIEAFAWIDMYLMFHVGYYDKRGILMFHPAKTAIWYLKGNFVLDLLAIFPLYTTFRSTIPTGHIYESLLHDAPGLLMVLQIYKFFQACYYLENDILRRTEHIKILKFIPLAVIVTNIVTAGLILLECSSDFTFDEISHHQPLIAKELQQSVILFCKPHSSSLKFPENLTVSKMYVTAFYWATYTLTGVGFGDLTANDKNTMIAVMIIIFLGIFLYGYIFANLTGNMISVHNIVAKCRRRMREMIKFMKQKNVSQDIQKRLILHYEYNWLRTEGSSPQKMFNQVHATLKENLVASMYEAMFRQVPAFVEVKKSVIGVIGKHLDEIYFLRGETIIKYNDVQQNIYLIYRGEVNVFSKNGALITTMGSGGMFGNISNQPFSLSSVAVVAIKNVDILKLDCDIFFKALQVSSNTKPLVDFLTSTTTDFIEPFNETTQEAPQQAEIDTLPYEIMSRRDFKRAINLSDFAAEGAHFYLKNSIFKPPKTSFHKFIILANSPLHKAICICVFLLAYVSGGIVTIYMFAFQDFTRLCFSVAYLIDLMFYIKIFLQFHLSYQNKHGDFVVNERKIKERYLSSMKTIGIDIIANMPTELFVLVLSKNWTFQALSILRLNRILRLYYIFEFYELKFKVLMVNKIYLKLSWILVWTSVMIHFFACIWFFVACPLGECQSPTWVTELSLGEDKKLQAYIVSVYYVISLITTTGYGDIPIFSTAAMLVSIVFMIISQFGIVFMAGAVAAVINDHSLNLFMFQERINDLKTNFLRQNMSEYQVVKMWNYVTSLWLHESGKKIPKFITDAPYAMRCEVMYAMFGSHLSQSYVFFEMDETFLCQLSIYLNRSVYFPGNYIVQQGDIDHTMYFIHSGKVSVLTIHSNLMETIHFALIKNDLFGMTQGLTIGKAHKFSYRAETDAEILSLTLSHWKHLLKYFPEIGQKINERIDNLPNLYVNASQITQ